MLNDNFPALLVKIFLAWIKLAFSPPEWTFRSFKKFETGFENTREVYTTLIDDLGKAQQVDIPNALKTSSIINSKKLINVDFIAIKLSLRHQIKILKLNLTVVSCC